MSLNVPSGLIVDGRAVSALTLRWNSVSGVDSYELKVTPADAPNVVTAATSILVVGLHSNREYDCAVRARSGSLTSNWSASVKTLTLPPPPPPPSAVPPAPMQVAARLQWDYRSIQNSLDNGDKLVVDLGTVNPDGTVQELTGCLELPVAHEISFAPVSQTGLYCARLWMYSSLINGGKNSSPWGASAHAIPVTGAYESVDLGLERVRFSESQLRAYYATRFRF